MVDAGKDVPLQLQEPTLEQFLVLRNDDGGDVTDRDEKNHAFTFMVEHLMPRISGIRGWKEEMCSKKVSDSKMTPSDEAFILLCLENMWEKWHSPSETTARTVLHGMQKKST